jgi:N-acetylmuramoyl-L-alanine amidase
MKSLVGIIGTATLLAAVSINNPCIVAKASPNIVETMGLPEEPELLTYEDFSALYSCKENHITTNPNIVEVSVEDAWMLMKIAVCEAGEGSDYKSQAYVMSVVLNRIKDPKFPDTVNEVLHQDTQFSTVENGKYDSAIPNVNSHYALAAIEGGEINTEALYFEAEWLEGSWQSKHRKYLFSYGGHRFYK